MNVAKDDSIVELLAQLDIQRRGWTICDYWEADLCAIGISSHSCPHRLVYISTFGKPSGRFDYECEHFHTDAKGDPDYDTIDEGCDVDLLALVEVMERHLGTHEE